MPAACDGLLVAVAHGHGPCIKPGSGESFKDCPDCPEMVIAPAGSFSMGSPGSEPKRQRDEAPQHKVTIDIGEPEAPQHKVTIGEPFAVGRFAVTRDEFEAFVKDSGYRRTAAATFGRGSTWNSDSAKSWRSPGFTQTGVHPVVCVNWNDTKAYVAWLSKKTGKEYRLLSEAEREYVARAGTKTPFWWGSRLRWNRPTMMETTPIMAAQGGIAAEDRAGKVVQGEPLGPLSSPRQCLGVGGGLLARRLP